MEINFVGKTKRCPKLPRFGVNREMCYSLFACDVMAAILDDFDKTFHFGDRRLHCYINQPR
jgi:hypothetical protein